MPRPIVHLATFALLLVANCLSAQAQWRTLPELCERRMHAMAYDPERKVVVMFGGHVFGLDSLSAVWAPKALGDTWEWDGQRWWRRKPKNSPSPRRGAMMAYDPNTKKVILYGGGSTGKGDQSTIYSDTWAWDGQDWTELRTFSSPGARLMPSMATDPVRKRVVMFGGATKWDFLGPLQDTWEWDGQFWRQRNPITVPQVRSCGGMAWSWRHQRIVLFGGMISKFVETDKYTWEWDGSNWSRRDPAVRPKLQEHGRALTTMCSDPIAGGVLLELSLKAGGSESWRWDGSSWTLIASMAAGLNRSGGTAGVCEHASSGTIVATGGLGEYFKDSLRDGRNTWTFDGKAWTLADRWQVPGASTTVAENAIFGPLVEDPGRDRLILCGGNRGDGQQRVWALHGERWHELKPKTAPPSDLETYDGVGLTHRGEVLQLYRHPKAQSSETWLWNGVTWRQSSPTGGPQYPNHLAYDSKRQRALAWDGFALTLSEWKSEAAGWRVLNTGSGGPPLGIRGMDYDPLRDRLVVVWYSSAAQQLVVDEFDGASWVPRSRLVQPPAQAINHAIQVEYLPELGGILIFGGNHPLKYPSSEAWLYDGSTWRKMPFGSPQLGTTLAVAAYDPARGRLVSGAPNGSLNGPEWAELILEELTADEQLPRPGDRVTLQYQSSRHSGGYLLYALALGQHPGIPFLPQAHFGPRSLPLTPDALFLASLAGPNLSVVNAAGNSQLAMWIPKDPALIDFDFHAAAVHLQGLQFTSVTNPVRITVVR